MEKIDIAQLKAPPINYIANLIFSKKLPKHNFTWELIKESAVKNPSRGFGAQNSF